MRRKITLCLMTCLLALTPVQAQPAPRRHVPVIEVYGHWEKPPQVIVCSSFPGGIQDVRRALKDLRRHGAHIKPEPIYGPCTFPPDEGTIVLIGPLFGVGGPVLGATLPLTEGDVIKSAIISFDIGHAYGVTLRHELVHAMGLNHTMELSHLMAPSTLIGGRSWAGIEEALERDRMIRAARKRPAVR